MDMNGTTLIARSVETVFAYVNDLSNDIHWRTGVTGSGLRSGDAVGVGAVGYVRAGDAEAEYRIVSFKPGESVDWEFLSGPYKGRGGYRFEPVDGGTRFTLVAEVEPSGFYKLLGPLFNWFGKRQNQADVEKLRNILEAMPE